MADPLLWLGYVSVAIAVSDAARAAIAMRQTPKNQSALIYLL